MSLKHSPILQATEYLDRSAASWVGRPQNQLTNLGIIIKQVYKVVVETAEWNRIEFNPVSVKV